MTGRYAVHDRGYQRAKTIQACVVRLLVWGYRR